MTTGSILLTVLLGSPGAPPTDVRPNFADRIDTVDVTISDTDVVLDALDASGYPIGSIALWVDPDGVTWIASDYDDGYMLVGIDPATLKVTREGDLTSEAASERATAIADIAASQSPLEHSWGECGWKAAQAGVACAFVKPFGCVVGGIRAACACVPVIVKEFESYECPWGL